MEYLQHASSASKIGRTEPQTHGPPLMNGNEWIIVIYTQNTNLHQLFMVNGCVFNLLDDEILEILRAMV